MLPQNLEHMMNFGVGKNPEEIPNEQYHHEQYQIAV